MLADDAARGGAEAADRLEAKLGDFVEAKDQYKALIDPERKGRVNDWLANIRAKAGPQKYKYVNSIDGAPIQGGAGRRTDRVRSNFDDGIEEQGSVYDRVWAGIGDDAPAPSIKSGDTIDVGGKPIRFEAVTRKAPSGVDETEVRAIRTLSDGEEVDAGTTILRHRGDGSLMPANITVEPALQRKGVATKMLDLAESQTGRRVIRSESETADGAALLGKYTSRGPKRAGADLDAEYDDLVARAANADGPDDLAKIAKQAGDIEDEIFKRVEARGGRDAEQVAKIRANREKYGWSSSDVAARRAEKLGVAGPARPMSAKAAAEAEDLAAFDRIARGNQGDAAMAHRYPTADEMADIELGRMRDMAARFTREGKADLAAQMNAAIARRSTPVPAKRSIADDILASSREAPAIEVVDRTAGRFVDDAAEAVQIVGNMERSTFELANELGPAAPPAMQKFAADYAAAIDDQARKMTEAMAAKADDVAKSTALMTLPRPPAATPGVLAGKGGKALDALAMLDTANEFAQVIPGMPNARDIPVVGPLLSMYLKFRAIKSLRGGLGGRIAATSEAKVAARSAELRDKVAGIVDDLLMASSKGAKVARKPVVVGGAKLMDSLKHSLYPDGEERKEQKTPAEALKARVKELATATSNPDAVRAAVRQQVGATNPDVSAAIESAVLRKLQYLQKHAPKAPPPGPLGAKPWHPSTSEIERFARRIRAAEDPATVLQDFEAGTLTPEAAETLRVVYPAMFAEVQTRLLTRAAELEAKLPYQRVLQASLLFDVPLDTSLRPENLRLLQEAHSSPAATGEPAQGQNAGPQPPAPSVASPVNLSRLYETPEMRRATRR
jgi:hypothetical protein